jgi:predicted nucleic acid-binding protein
LHIPNWRSEADALIAATALIHNMAVVTRNAKDFEGTGIVVVDPWQG